MEPLLRMPQIIAMTGLTSMSIYRLVKKGQFPRQIKITKKGVAWLHSEVEEWLQQRIAAREAAMGCEVRDRVAA